MHPHQQQQYLSHQPKHQLQQSGGWGHGGPAVVGVGMALKCEWLHVCKVEECVCGWVHGGARGGGAFSPHWCCILNPFPMHFSQPFSPTIPPHHLPSPFSPTIFLDHAHRPPCGQRYPVRPHTPPPHLPSMHHTLPHTPAVAPHQPTTAGGAGV